MYETLIKNYLTHYQPELKIALTKEHRLQPFLEQQAAAMQDTRNRLLAQLEAHYPQMSPLQREMEADHQVREMFLPLS